MTDMPQETRTERRERERREKYYSASQWTLIWWRFRRHRAAMVASAILGLMILLGLFAEFFAPYGPTETQRQLHVWRAASARNSATRMGAACAHSCPDRGQSVTRSRCGRSRCPTPRVRRYVHFFVEGQPTQLLGVIPIQTRLFGLEGGERLHLWGTDDLGRDVFSRTALCHAHLAFHRVLGGADLFQLGAADWGELPDMPAASPTAPSSA